MSDLIDGYVPLVVGADAWASRSGVAAPECDIDRGLPDGVAGESVLPGIPDDGGERGWGRGASGLRACAAGWMAAVMSPCQTGLVVSVRCQHVTGGAGALAARLTALQAPI